MMNFARFALRDVKIPALVHHVNDGLAFLLARARVERPAVRAVNHAFCNRKAPLLQFGRREIFDPELAIDRDIVLSHLERAVRPRGGTRRRRPIEGARQAESISRRAPVACIRTPRRRCAAAPGRPCPVQCRRRSLAGDGKRGERDCLLLIARRLFPALPLLLQQPLLRQAAQPELLRAKILQPLLQERSVDARRARLPVLQGACVLLDRRPVNQTWTHHQRAIPCRTGELAPCHLLFPAQPLLLQVSLPLRLLLLLHLPLTLDVLLLLHLALTLGLLLLLAHLLLAQHLLLPLLLQHALLLHHLLLLLLLTQHLLLHLLLLVEIALGQAQRRPAVRWPGGCAHDREEQAKHARGHAVVSHSAIPRRLRAPAR